MRNVKDIRKYLVWAALALACVVVDVGFFFALGGAVKWVAGLASPLVWAGIAAVAIVGARLVRLLEGTRFIRAEPDQDAVTAGR